MATSITENPPQNNSSRIPPESTNKQTLNDNSAIRKNIMIFLTSNFKKVIKGEYNHKFIVFDVID